ncbi:DUF2946 family protein [Bordetella sp. BOR01]|uniref:DUF2946 family protein n=1 Tax=Bordetella sp. BOR01 TaxID=2854779 RepID=UPI001C483AD1|nr:DUF2946 family protein [Bordetella sp. BOR01]MBV7486806.1 DUF2946 family protein [Bordetella sp. BOR01]
MRSSAAASTLIRHRAAIWLALCVFALKALVPQGFMPGSDPGTTLIQLCSAAGPVWVEGPHKAGHQQDAQHAEQSAVCSVGVALAALPLSSMPAAVVPLATVTLRIAARAPPAPATQASPGAPLGARAPPFLLG